MKAFTVITFICLSHFSSFGQSMDSLILGGWNWVDKNENTVVLKRMNALTNSLTTLNVLSSDTLYRSMRAIGCGNGPRKHKYKLRRGTWHIDSNGRFVIQYQDNDSPFRFVGEAVEHFEVIDSTKRKITLKRVT